MYEPNVKLAQKDGYFLRPDFWITTGNKQLAFLQHIYTMLDKNGKAVNPINFFFNDLTAEEYEEVIKIASRPTQSL